MGLAWLIIVVVNLLLIAAVEILRRKQLQRRSQALIVSGIAVVLFAPIFFGILEVRAAFHASFDDGLDPVRVRATDAVTFAALATASLLVPALFCLLELVRLSLMPAEQSSSLPRKMAGVPQAFQFALLGATVYMASFWVALNWVSIATFLMGTSREAFVSAQMPAWLRILYRTIEYGPWLIALGFLAFALVRKQPLPFSAFLGGSIGTAIILSTAILFEPWVTDIMTREPFDAAVWKAENGPHAQRRRSRMLNDLLSTHRLVNMTREQINSLLGVPPPSPYFRPSDYVYWLGSVDSACLVLRFEREIVAEAKVASD